MFTAILSVAMVVADDPFTEKVTVIPFAGGKLIAPHKDIPAYPRSVAGTPGWALKCGHLYQPGSQIIQADGTKWIVVKSYDAAPEVRIEAKKAK